MHIPVLLDECLNGLAIKEHGTYVDCTTNRGGHSKEIAKKLGKDGTLVCVDLDENALKEARAALEGNANGPKIHFIKSNFRHLESILKDLKITRVDGVLADLGVSSQELDEARRGFSFRYDEPLLMTFDVKPEEDATTAFDIVNFWSESTIADVLYGFADERYARKIAHAIVTARVTSPIKTTFELVSVISSAVPAMYKHRKIHFATKTFQALRIATNDELGSINDLMDALPNVLASGGRACVITFHSTEDRVVKTKLRNYGEALKAITKKPIMPTQEELTNNVRARSAKLRIVERV